MTKLYKLTDKYGRTHNETQWGENVTHSGTGEGELCGPGFIHAYTHPLLAVLLNPIHSNVKSPVLWEAEGEIAKTDHGLKVGCVSLTTLRQIPLPVVTMEQRVRFGILCALKVKDSPRFVKWANGWLSGEVRSEMAAAWAARAALAAAEAAEAAAARAAAWAWAARAKPLDLIAIAEEACR